MARCIFCENKADSKEHLYGAWLQKVYNVNPSPKGKRRHLESRVTPDGAPFVATNGNFSKGGHQLNTTVQKAICQSCNSSWLSDIQDYMRPIFKKFTHNGDLLLSSADQKTIVQWLYLKQLLYQFATETLNGLSWDQRSALQAQRVNCPPEEQLVRAKEKWLEDDCAYFRRNVLPPSDVRFFVSRALYDNKSLGGFNYVPRVAFYSRRGEGQIRGFAFGYLTLIHIGHFFATIHKPIVVQGESMVSLPISLPRCLIEISSRWTKEVMLNQVRVSHRDAEHRLLSHLVQQSQGEVRFNYP
ncbi:MAG: hypothetical protein AAF822_12465 [Pseudomonadota bacterium]